MDSNQVNPYASPADYQESPPGFELLADGKVLVAYNDVIFPDRCVKCNAPAKGYRLPFSLSWHPPALYFLVPIILVYLLVAVIVGKKRTFHIGLCPKHRKRRRGATIISCLSFLIGLGIFFLSIGMQTPEFLFLGAPLLMTSALVHIIGVQTMTAQKIDNEKTWLKGASLEFLASLSADNETAVFQ